MNAVERLVEFAAAIPTPPKKEKGEHRILAGAAIALPGLATIGGASKMLRVAARSIGGRNASKIAGAIPAPQRVKQAVQNALVKQGKQHGKMAADYIEGADSLLKGGVHGRLVGKTLRHANAYPEGKVNKALGGADGISHYANFRAGPVNALRKWDDEVAATIESLPEGLAGRALQKKTSARKKILKGHQKDWDRVIDDVDINIEGGRSEVESIRKVLTKPENSDYSRRLVANKAENVPYYAKIAALSPAMIAAGGGVAATTRKDKRKTSR